MIYCLCIAVFASMQVWEDRAAACAQSHQFVTNLSCDTVVLIVSSVRIVTCTTVVCVRDINVLWIFNLVSLRLSHVVCWQLHSLLCITDRSL